MLVAEGKPGHSAGAVSLDGSTTSLLLPPGPVQLAARDRVLSKRAWQCEYFAGSVFNPFLPDELSPPPEGCDIHDWQDNHTCIPCYPSEFRAHEFGEAHENHKSHEPADKKPCAGPFRM